MENKEMILDRVFVLGTNSAKLLRMGGKIDLGRVRVGTSWGMSDISKNSYHRLGTPPERLNERSYMERHGEFADEAFDISMTSNDGANLDRICTTSIANMAIVWSDLKEHPEAGHNQYAVSANIVLDGSLGAGAKFKDGLMFYIRLRALASPWKSQSGTMYMVSSQEVTYDLVPIGKDAFKELNQEMELPTRYV